MTLPSEMIPRMRELQRDWLAQRQEDVQLSLTDEGGQMLPPIVNSDPGDETEQTERVSWDDGDDERAPDILGMMVIEKFISGDECEDISCVYCKRGN